MPKDPTIEVYESESADPKQRYRWRAVASNGRILADSGEGYVRRAEAAKRANYVVREPHPDAETKVIEPSEEKSA
jgi:uncharacterized protein